MVPRLLLAALGPAGRGAPAGAAARRARAALARLGVRLAAVLLALGAVFAPGTALAAVGWCNEYAQSIEAPLVVFQVHGGEVRAAPPCLGGADQGAVGAPTERPALPELASSSPDRLAPDVAPPLLGRPAFHVLTFAALTGGVRAPHTLGVFRPPRG